MLVLIYLEMTAIFLQFVSLEVNPAHNPLILLLGCKSICSSQEWEVSHNNLFLYYNDYIYILFHRSKVKFNMNNLKI